ncbi:retrovirus-related pol polyprotein from transposon TNT 1-94, partial [Tanacetum coccineum]
TANPPYSQDPKSSHDDGSKPSSDDEKKVNEDPRKENECNDQEKEVNVNSTNNVNAASTNKHICFLRDDKDDGVVADMNNLDTTIQFSPIPTTRIHKDHPLNQVIGDLQSATQTRKMSKNLEEHGKNLKRMKGEGIHYDEVFSPVARTEAIRLFLAYASFKDFVVDQMDVKSAFLYGKIEEEVYVCQPPGFEDPDFPDRVYKVEKALYGLHQAPRACRRMMAYLLVKTNMLKKNLKKFGFIEVKTASTPMETQKPLLKDENSEEVDVHMYRSMIGSLRYLTSSRPDIMFAACACARYQVNPKVSYLHA